MVQTRVSTFFHFSNLSIFPHTSFFFPMIFLMIFYLLMIISNSFNLLIMRKVEMQRGSDYEEIGATLVFVLHIGLAYPTLLIYDEICLL
jgi:hypothetical protein